MLKFGIISQIDLDKGLARVFFEADGMVSGWLKMGVIKSLNDQFTFPYDVNEHVYCLMDERCEYGVICGAVYDDKNKPAGAAKGVLKIKFADNSTIKYDRNSHILSFDIKGDVKIDCTGKADVTATEVNIAAVNTNITGALKVTGMALVGGLGSATPGVAIPTQPGTELTIEKISATTVEATGDVKAGNISLKTHKHTSAASGSPTSTPIP